jgi:hypothetical protein
MRRLLCVIGALALTAGGAGATTVKSGLRGTVYSLSGGACLQDGCGKRPLAGAMLVFTLDGRSVTTMTHSDGSFRVGLTPGTYTVHLGKAVRARSVMPVHATVMRGRFRAMTFVVAGPKIP